MLNETTAKLLNEQINKELYSAYLYLDIANYFEEKGLSGFSNWYNVQAAEERDHALKLVHYLHETSTPVKLLPIDAPAYEFKGVADAVEAALKHEKFISASIDYIYTEALKTKEYRTAQFLDWFVAEQVEEESNAEALLTKVNLVGEHGAGLLALDGQLSARK